MYFISHLAHQNILKSTTKNGAKSPFFFFFFLHENRDVLMMPSRDFLLLFKVGLVQYVVVVRIVNSHKSKSRTLMYQGEQQRRIVSVPLSYASPDDGLGDDDDGGYRSEQAPLRTPQVRPPPSATPSALSTSNVELLQMLEEKSNSSSAAEEAFFKGESRTKNATSWAPVNDETKNTTTRRPQTAGTLRRIRPSSSHAADATNSAAFPTTEASNVTGAVGERGPVDGERGALLTQGEYRDALVEGDRGERPVSALAIRRNQGLSLLGRGDASSVAAPMMTGNAAGKRVVAGPRVGAAENAKAAAPHAPQSSSSNSLQRLQPATPDTLGDDRMLQHPPTSASSHTLKDPISRPTTALSSEDAGLTATSSTVPDHPVSLLRTPDLASRPDQEEPSPPAGVKLKQPQQAAGKQTTSKAPQPPLGSVALKESPQRGSSSSASKSELKAIEKAAKVTAVTTAVKSKVMGSPASASPRTAKPPTRPATASSGRTGASLERRHDPTSKVALKVQPTKPERSGGRPSSAALQKSGNEPSKLLSEPGDLILQTSSPASTSVKPFPSTGAQLGGSREGLLRSLPQLTFTELDPLSIDSTKRQGLTEKNTAGEGAESRIIPAPPSSPPLTRWEGHSRKRSEKTSGDSKPDGAPSGRRGSFTATSVASSDFFSQKRSLDSRSNADGGVGGGGQGFPRSASSAGSPIPTSIRGTKASERLLALNRQKTGGASKGQRVTFASLLEKKKQKNLSRLTDAARRVMETQIQFQHRMAANVIGLWFKKFRARAKYHHDLRIYVRVLKVNRRIKGRHDRIIHKFQWCGRKLIRWLHDPFLNKGALALQSLWRGYRERSAHKSLERLRRFRDVALSTILQIERPWFAARAIQRCWRKSLLIDRTRRFQQARISHKVRQMQRGFRQHLWRRDRKVLQRSIEECTLHAARVIQRAYRRHRRLLADRVLRFQQLHFPHIAQRSSGKSVKLLC